MSKHRILPSVLALLVGLASLCYAQSPGGCSLPDLKDAMSRSGQKEDFQLARCVGDALMNESVGPARELFQMFSNHPKVVKQTAFIRAGFRSPSSRGSSSLPSSCGRGRAPFATRDVNWWPSRRPTAADSTGRSSPLLSSRDGW